MKQFLILFYCLISISIMGSKDEQFLKYGLENTVPDCDNPNKLTFEKDTLYFDTIVDGEKVNFTFNFTVTGCDTIKIHQVYTGCSCTSPSYDTIPLAPGDKGKVKIVFKSKGWGDKTGNLAMKHIYVLYNGGSQAIFFKGVVIKPE